jgi:hypothetical protein
MYSPVCVCLRRPRERVCVQEGVFLTSLFLYVLILLGFSSSSKGMKESYVQFILCGQSPAGAGTDYVYYRSTPLHYTHTDTSRERREAGGPSGPSRPGLTPSYIGALGGLAPQRGARAPSSSVEEDDEDVKGFSFFLRNRKH